ncbi:uncharacterized protein F4822DRAFT_261508 [Hypoxylon trugodes]|uniref:uncharacterized protein n=1 Tax=Hypoxylon trugodes TaxID=326681 RepID=UPI00219BAA04|nr:uncharacterized protein F4822DRAFT_261508 [Hypoxylon trugodes]KAI1388891.1 hypothetical protein F4822DRAFT_261508 [Hypoxylon trugodes]
MSLAPAVTRDGFAYAGDLFAEASGHNRHRRATVAELKDHFKSGNEKDHPAHWFEAQLIHYGLQPSKTKAVARMRLYDAVNGGKLSIPTHIKQLESDLKREWTKNERDAKKALSAPAATTTTKSTKRKAEASYVDLTVNVGDVNITVSAGNAKKKAKTTATTAKPSTPTKSPKKAAEPKAKATPKPKTAKMMPLKAALKTPTNQKLDTIPSSSLVSPTRPKQTARRGGLHQGPGRAAPRIPASSPAPSRPKQTARRSGAFSARGRIPGPSSSPGTHYHVIDSDSNEDRGPPPPYSEYPSHDDSDNDFTMHSRNLRPLGLLNGRYHMDCPYVAEQWDYDSFSLVLTLSGTELLGRFDFGVITGVLRLPQRPWQSSLESLQFRWRGREDEGPIIYGDQHTGEIRFLGDGRIEGEIDYMGGIKFTGDRAPGQGTRSGIDAQTLKNEWESYNESEYEAENRGRW